MDYWIPEMHSFLSRDDLLPWLATLPVAMLLAFVVKIVLKAFVTRMRVLTTRTSTIWDDVGMETLELLRTWVIFVWLYYFLTRTFHSSDFMVKTLPVALIFSSVFQAAVCGLYVLQSWRKKFLDKKIEEDPSVAATLGLFYTFLQAIFIGILALMGLNNLGVNISALLAGLGVGGIAVALAAQNVLGDLFASLSIVIDKPFVVGDFIVTGDEKGTVEKIGVRSTRLRSLSGEELVISNKNLLEGRIQNFKRMWRRRVLHKFGVLYSTPLPMLELIPQWVKGIIEGEDKLQFDRCHFCAYGASSLDFEMVFYVADADYNLFMQLQQKILLDILRKFGEQGVELAYPTQSIYFERKMAANGPSARPST